MTPEFWAGFEKQAGAADLLRQTGTAIKNFAARHGVEGQLGKDISQRLVKDVGGSSGASTSLVSMPFKWLSKKVIGKDLHNRLGDAINKGILDVDTVLGKPFDIAASKMSITKNLFKQEELVPMGKDMFKKVNRSSISAPLQGIRNIAVPMIASSSAYSYLQKRKEQRAREEQQGGNVQ